jgi:putative transposase
VVTPAAKREATAHLQKSFAVSQRRACSVLKVDRSMVRYSKRRADDAPLRTKIRDLAAQRRRFSYRRIHLMLKRQSEAMNLKKLRRLYAEEKLQVKRRGGRKRAVGTRRPMAVPTACSQRWSLDFVSGAFTDGRRFRNLAVVDDFTRECLSWSRTPRSAAPASRGSWTPSSLRAVFRTPAFPTTEPS